MGWLRATGYRLSSGWNWWVASLASWFVAARLSRGEAAKSRRLRRELADAKRQLKGEITGARQVLEEIEREWKSHLADKQAELDGANDEVAECRRVLSNRDDRIEELEADIRRLETELSAEQLGVKVMASFMMSHRELFNSQAEMHAAMAGAFTRGRE